MSSSSKVTTTSEWDSEPDFLAGLDEECEDWSDSEDEAPVPIYTAKRTPIPSSIKERARKDAEFADFAGTFFDEVDFDTERDAEIPKISVAELVQRVGTEYPKCPDIDAQISLARRSLGCTWLKLGHSKSVRERMKKSLIRKKWTCTNCRKTIHITDCLCGHSIDEHFRHDGVPGCMGFNPALQAEHGSLVCVHCLTSMSDWPINKQRKELLHSISDWLIFLRVVLTNVQKKVNVNTNLHSWKEDIDTYSKLYAPALQTLLEYDPTAINDNDLFFPNRPNNQTDMYRRFKFNGVLSSATWNDLWLPALQLLETPRPWKEVYFSACALGGQFGIALALWVKACGNFEPDPERRQFLKQNETLDPTDPWTSGYLRYSHPYDVWLPALDRLICFWVPLTICGPGKCLQSLTIGVNELLYNYVKGIVTYTQNVRRHERNGGDAANVSYPPALACALKRSKARHYKPKRGKTQRGRDFASGNGVREDTPGVEDFSVMCAAVVKMITGVTHVPVLGVCSTGAFHYVNHVQTMCNRNRAVYSSRYRKETPEPSQLNACYSDVLSFIRVLRLYNLPMVPPLYPSRQDVARGNVVWKLPEHVQSVVDEIPLLGTKLESAVRYMYNGLPLTRVEKIGDLITNEMKHAIQRLDEPAHCPDDGGGGGGKPCPKQTRVAALKYYATLKSKMSVQTIKLTRRRELFETKLKEVHRLHLQHLDAVKDTTRTFEQDMANLRARFRHMTKYMQGQTDQFCTQIHDLKQSIGILKNQLDRVYKLDAELEQQSQRQMCLVEFHKIAHQYNMDQAKHPPRIVHHTKKHASGGGDDDEYVLVPKKQLKDMRCIVDEVRKHVIVDEK